MKGKLNIFTKLGVLIYVLYSIVDRSIIKISNPIAIPVMILGIIFIIIGFIETPKRNNQ